MNLGIPTHFRGSTKTALNRRVEIYIISYCVCILIYWEHSLSKLLIRFLPFRYWSSMKSESPKRYHTVGNTLAPNCWKAGCGGTSIPLPLRDHVEHLPPSVKESSMWVPTACTVTLLWVSWVSWKPLIKLGSLLEGSQFPQVWLSLFN